MEISGDSLYHKDMNLLNEQLLFLRSSLKNLKKTKISKSMSWKFPLINLFVCNAPFPSSLKTFSKGREKVHWKQMG